MTLFNNPEYSDLTLILKDTFEPYNEKKLFCHRAILINNGSSYFLSSNNFKEKNQTEFIISTEDAECDTKIIESIYSGECIDISNYTCEEKIILAIKATFYGADKIKNMIMENVYNNIRPNDFNILIKYNYAFPLNKEQMIKYMRLFFVNIEDLNLIIEKLMEINPNIVKGIFQELIDKPIFALNFDMLKKFYGAYNVKPNKDLYRAINKNEIQKFSHLPKIEQVIVFHMDHFVLYKIINSYHQESILYKLNFDNMEDDKLKTIHKECQVISVVKKVGDILINKNSRKETTTMKNNPFSFNPSDNPYNNGSSDINDLYKSFFGANK